MKNIDLVLVWILYGSISIHFFLCAKGSIEKTVDLDDFSRMKKLLLCKGEKHKWFCCLRIRKLWFWIGLVGQPSINYNVLGKNSSLWYGMPQVSVRRRRVLIRIWPRNIVHLQMILEKGSVKRVDVFSICKVGQVDKSYQRPMIRLEIQMKCTFFFEWVWNCVCKSVNLEDGWMFLAKIELWVWDNIFIFSYSINTFKVNFSRSLEKKGNKLIGLDEELRRGHQEVC